MTHAWSLYWLIPVAFIPGINVVCSIVMLILHEVFQPQIVEAIEVFESIFYYVYQAELDKPSNKSVDEEKEDAHDDYNETQKVILDVHSMSNVW